VRRHGGRCSVAVENVCSRCQREGRLRASQYFSYSWEYGGEPFGSLSVRKEADVGRCAALAGLVAGLTLALSLTVRFLS
jgi:hypothetical protein